LIEVHANVYYSCFQSMVKTVQRNRFSFYDHKMAGDCTRGDQKVPGLT